MKFTRCFRCMKETNSYPCPHCGYDPGRVPAQLHALKTGTILNGKYVVGAILGQGGFGITYIGWDLALESRVAIKEYFPSGQVVRSPENSLTLQWYTTPQAEAARNAGREMFLKEARKMSRVGSIPQVVRVRDLFQENDTAYIVMDFVEGETLMARLKKTGPLSWEQAQKIFLPAIRAMEQVHQEGLIHRDLSPDNLMLLPNGDVRILDLGAAKDLTINSGASSMQVAKGGFSPLEQYTQRGSSGPWSDVYAMAATMYYSLTGVLPPTSVDRVEADTIRWDLPALMALPKPVLDALKKAMTVFAKDRTQTMGALLSALEPGAATGKAKKKARTKLPLLLLAVALALFGVWKFLPLHQEKPGKTTVSPQLTVETTPTAIEVPPTQTEETVPEETFDLSPYVGIPHAFYTEYHGELSETAVQCYNCTFYDLENGQTKVVVELLAPAGYSIFAEGFEESETYEYTTSPNITTGKRQTIAFDVPTEKCDVMDDYWYWIALYVGDPYTSGDWMGLGISPQQRLMVCSEGTPVGAVKRYTPSFAKGHCECHSLTTQELDNGYVRFTMDFTAPNGLQVIFNAVRSNAEWNTLVSYTCSELATDGRQTLVWDVLKEDIIDANVWHVELGGLTDGGETMHDVFNLWING